MISPSLLDGTVISRPDAILDYQSSVVHKLGSDLCKGKNRRVYREGSPFKDKALEE